MTLLLLFDRTSPRPCTLFVRTHSPNGFTVLSLRRWIKAPSVVLQLNRYSTESCTFPEASQLGPISRGQEVPVVFQQYTGSLCRPRTLTRTLGERGGGAEPGGVARGDGVDSRPGNLSKGLWEARDATAARAQEDVGAGPASLVSRNSNGTGFVSSRRVSGLHPLWGARRGRCKGCCCGICMEGIVSHCNTNTTTCPWFPVPDCHP